MDMQLKYEEIVGRNIGVLTWEEQEKIRNANVSVIDLGDQDITSILVAKIGFNKIVMGDNSDIEIQHLNSQFFSTYDMVGTSKAHMARQLIHTHNPLVECECHPMDSLPTVPRVKKILQGTDYCIITARCPYVKITAARAAQELKIPYTISEDIGAKIFAATFQPGDLTYEEFSNQPSLGKELSKDLYEEVYQYRDSFYKACGGYLPQYENLDALFTHALPMISFYSASFSVGEVVKMILGKGKVFYAPSPYAVDLLTGKKWDVQGVYDKIQCVKAGVREP